MEDQFHQIETPELACQMERVLLLAVDLRQEVYLYPEKFEVLESGLLDHLILLQTNFNSFDVV